MAPIRSKFITLFFGSFILFSCNDSSDSKALSDNEQLELTQLTDQSMADLEIEENYIDEFEDKPFEKKDFQQKVIEAYEKLLISEEEEFSELKKDGKIARITSIIKSILITEYKVDIENIDAQRTAKVKLESEKKKAEEEKRQEAERIRQQEEKERLAEAEKKRLAEAEKNRLAEVERQRIETIRQNRLGIIDSHIDDYITILEGAGYDEDEEFNELYVEKRPELKEHLYSKFSSLGVQIEALEAHQAFFYVEAYTKQFLGFGADFDSDLLGSLQLTAKILRNRELFLWLGTLRQSYISGAGYADEVDLQLILDYKISIAPREGISYLSTDHHNYISQTGGAMTDHVTNNNYYVSRY